MAPSKPAANSCAFMDRETSREACALVTFLAGKYIPSRARARSTPHETTCQVPDIGPHSPHAMGLSRKHVASTLTSTLPSPSAIRVNWVSTHPAVRVHGRRTKPAVSVGVPGAHTHAYVVCAACTLYAIFWHASLSVDDSCVTCRTMVTQLIEHERLETTHPKAKELSRWADRCVQLAKQVRSTATRRGTNGDQDAISQPASLCRINGPGHSLPDARFHALSPSCASQMPVHHCSFVKSYQLHGHIKREGRHAASAIAVTWRREA